MSLQDTALREREVAAFELIGESLAVLALQAKEFMDLLKKEIEEEKRLYNKR